MKGDVYAMIITISLPSGEIKEIQELLVLKAYMSLYVNGEFAPPMPPVTQTIWRISSTHSVQTFPLCVTCVNRDGETPDRILRRFTCKRTIIYERGLRKNGRGWEVLRRADEAMKLQRD